MSLNALYHQNLDERVVVAPLAEMPSRSRLLYFYSVILGLFLLLGLCSWPVLFSLDLWAFKDRGSSLNLDYLLSMGLRPGVDVYYSYGLLPVLLQHCVFAMFGRGYWPMLMLTFVYYGLAAAFWSCLIAPLAQARTFLCAFIVLIPLVLWINPNLPYCLVLGSMLGSFICVLGKRLDVALAVSTVGVFSVPSLSIVLVALLVSLILYEEWIASDRSARRTLLMLSYGFVTFICLAGLLVAVFGWQSLLSTLLPLKGAQFYKEIHYGFLSTGMEFLFPAKAGILHFFLAPPAWWIVSSALLLGFGIVASANIFRRHSLRPPETVVLICAILHFVFVLLAYGPAEQHVIYDPLLAAGVLLGIATMVRRNLRVSLLVVFAGLALLSHVHQVRATSNAWRNWRVSDATAGLYADSTWIADWSKILSLASRQHLLLLSYGTGVHHYFPSVESPQVWFMQVGQLSSADRERVLSQMKAAEVLVEDLSGPTAAIDKDPIIRQQLDSLCLVETNTNFQVWFRHADMRESENCKTNAR